jgi:hypothetical protein
MLLSRYSLPGTQNIDSIIVHHHDTLALPRFYITIFFRWEKQGQIKCKKVIDEEKEPSKMKCSNKSSAAPNPS